MSCKQKGTHKLAKVTYNEYNNQLWSSVCLIHVILQMKYHIILRFHQLLLPFHQLWGFDSIWHNGTEDSAGISCLCIHQFSQQVQELLFHFKKLQKLNRSVWYLMVLGSKKKVQHLIYLSCLFTWYSRIKICVP